MKTQFRQAKVPFFEKEKRIFFNGIQPPFHLRHLAEKYPVKKLLFTYLSLTVVIGSLFSKLVCSICNFLKMNRKKITKWICSTACVLEVFRSTKSGDIALNQSRKLVRLSFALHHSNLMECNSSDLIQKAMSMRRWDSKMLRRKGFEGNITNSA